jgi:hypothetical protein
MAYNTQSYWIFGIFPSSGVLETIKLDVSETGSVSVLKLEGEDTYSVGSLRKTMLKWIGFIWLSIVTSGGLS